MTQINYIHKAIWYKFFKWRSKWRHSIKWLLAMPLRRWWFQPLNIVQRKEYTPHLRSIKVLDTENGRYIRPRFEIHFKSIIWNGKWISVACLSHLISTSNTFILPRWDAHSFVEVEFIVWNQNLSHTLLGTIWLTSFVFLFT